MNTYRELVYMVFDELKIVSDDSIWEVDHVVFMLNKYRSMLFKQRFLDKKREIPTVFYQRLNIDFSPNYYKTTIYKSKKRIPDLIIGGDMFKYTFIHSNRIQSYDLNLTNPRRFKNVGFNKYMVNQVYCTIDLDSFMYIKYNGDSSLIVNIQDENVPANNITSEDLSQLIQETNKTSFLYCDAILDNPLDQLDFNELDTDELDFEFPSDETTNQAILDLCIKELGIMNGLHQDKQNNAADDTPQQQQTKSNN